MGPVYYVMAILGCGDAGDQCRQMRLEPVRYPSAAQCQAAMSEALLRNSDLLYPVITAACQAHGTVMVGKEAEPRRG